MIRLAIFDCDGTLVDSGASIHRALETTLAAHGHAIPTRASAKRVIGLSLTQAMAELVPDGDHAALSQTYKDAFIAMRGAGAVEEPLYDGISELLDAFEAEGWQLAVATGKSDRGLRHCLDSHGLGDRFVSLQTADRNPSKPHPGMALRAMAEAGAEPAATVLIGDTSWDMGCATSALCGGIGAGWGYHSEAELLGAGAIGVADAPAAVMALASGWVGETGMIDEVLWKRRFLMFGLARLSGLAIIGLGLFVAFTDLVHQGGWRIGGALLIVVGTFELAFVPLLLRRKWERE